MAENGSILLAIDSPSTPNPVSIITGNKHFDLVDYSQTGIFPLRFLRHYSGLSAYQLRGASLNVSGYGWSHSYAKNIAVIPANSINATNALILTLETGQAFNFSKNSSGSWIPDADINYKLTGDSTNGWVVTTPDNNIETYSASGSLTSIKDNNGITQTLAYSDSTTPVTVSPYPGLLIKVTDSFNRSLRFTYKSSGQMATMIDPANNITRYDYDLNDNLTTVTYPDTNAITYIYDNINQPHALTGIKDENGVRYATYQYDASGRAIATEHSGGVEKYSLNFAPDGTSTAVTDPLGSIRTTHYTTILGVTKPTGTDQPGGSGCAAASSNITYDANGNVASRSDFNGNKTCYTYDLTSNLETIRIEGLPASTACPNDLATANITYPARKISTEWHTLFRLPKTVAEPKKITRYSYDSASHILTQTEQSTLDLTGASGLAPALDVTAHTTVYTYNRYGQILTIDGPRVDINDVTTYVYNPVNADSTTSGTLKTITNPLGQITTFNAYDANGRLLNVTGSAGIVTKITYTPRGQVKTLTINNELTQFDYTPTGLLKTVTAPDSSVLTYGYDDAHRLTGISDRLGNTVVFLLDNAGNRTSEQAKDPNNIVRRNISRVYDALNRLQNVIGDKQ